MPELYTYSQPDFPAIFKWQAIAFMRTEWSDIFQGDNLYMPETYPPDYQPVHFVLAEGDTLVSYAAILEVTLEHARDTYHIYGFGNMFTFAPFRKKGYGARVLKAATEYIKASSFDAAILFCDSKLEPFYATQGWQATRSPTRLGQRDKYEVYDPTRMMIFVSEKGRAGQSDFESQPVYVDWPW